MSSLPRRRAAAASSSSLDGPRASRVLLYGDSLEFKLLVRVIFGEIEVVAAGGEHPDLVVADATLFTPAVLDRVRAAAPDAPLLVVSPAGKMAANLRVNVIPDNIGMLTMGQVMQRFGRTAIATYLPALLRHHAGNVTRAAQGAGLKRESLHRLLRRHRLRAEEFRS